MVANINESDINVESFLYSGTHWQVSHQEYLDLLSESEYAAWVAAWGYRANHLNTTGGEIKGDETVKLEQSSTMADHVLVEFSDKTVAIPSCFYEFAKRYPMENGELYTGFVAASADKIFESTNAAA